MKILINYKWVLDETDITVDQEKRIMDTSRAKYKISEIDRNAIELGSTLKEKLGCDIISLTVGKGVKSSLKDVLSRGIDKAYYIESETLESSDTARILAAAIRKIGDVDLVICGEGSSDNYSQQVGPRLAGLLGYQLVTYASEVSPEDSDFKIVRKLEDEIETVKAKTPLVLTVVSEINEPKIPGMKQILSARKKPSEELKIEDLGLSPSERVSPVAVVKEGASIMDRKQVKLNNGDTSIKEAAVKLVQFLRNDKVI